MRRRDKRLRRTRLCGWIEWTEFFSACLQPDPIPTYMRSHWHAIRRGPARAPH